MTCWHTDKPVPPVAATSAIGSIAPASLFRTTPAASQALSTARAFYARRLRVWAKTHSHVPEKPGDPT